MVENGRAGALAESCFIFWGSWVGGREPIPKHERIALAAYPVGLRCIALRLRVILLGDVIGELIVGDFFSDVK